MNRVAEKRTRREFGAMAVFPRVDTTQKLIWSTELKLRYDHVFQDP
jgi:hypothetical protein